MKDYRLYDLEDFVVDEDFIRWVQDKGAAEDEFWNSWLEENPSRHLMIAEARLIVMSMRPAHVVVPPREVKMEIGKVLQVIRGGEGQAGRGMVVSKAVWRRWPGYAAILLLLVAGFFLIRSGRGRRESMLVYAAVDSSSTIELVNVSGLLMSKVLPDGSLVELAAGSRIRYAKDFGSGTTRDIYLSGEGYFNVTRSPGRTFRVFANEIVTKVLGTSFTVRSFEKDGTISVTVKTGKVSVCSQTGTEDKDFGSMGKGSDLIISPNQQLIYLRSNKKFQKKLVEAPALIVPDSLDRAMSYEDRPVEQVFDQMGKLYGINIVYDPELLSKCTVTADLTNESFYSKLDLICKAIGAKYEILDGQVVIQSEGCQ